MSSQRKFFLILSILIIILLIGGGLIGFLYWQSTQEESVETETEEQVDQITNQPVVNNVNSAEEVVEETGGTEIKDEDFLQQLSKSFTERYGSFSNQNDYENLLDLKIYMTNKMQGEVDDFIDSAMQVSQESEEQSYYGITTKVLTVNKIDLEDEKATYKVNCQRKEAKGLEGGNNTYKENATIEFKKVDGQWKVHSFTWL